MVKLIPVDMSEIPTTVGGRRGKVCYPLIKMFLDSNIKCSKLDRQNLPRTAQSLYTGLKGYIVRHDLPIKCFMADGEIYFIRQDLDDEGKVIPNWKEIIAEEAISA